MQFYQTHKATFSKVVGGVVTCFFGFYAVRYTTRLTKVFRYYSYFSTLLKDSSINYQRFLSSPLHSQFVIVPLTSKPHAKLFKHHQKYFDSDSGSRLQSFDAPIDNFEAQLKSKETPHRVWLTFQRMDPFLSRSVYFNNQYLSSSHKKKNLDFLAYGSMSYSKTQKRFVIQAQSIAATRQELQHAWSILLGRVLPAHLFIIGLGLGVGLSFISPYWDQLPTDTVKLWQKSKSLYTELI